MYFFGIVEIIVGIRIVKVRKINVIAKGLKIDLFSRKNVVLCALRTIFNKAHTIMMFFAALCTYVCVKNKLCCRAFRHRPAVRYYIT